MWKKNDFLNKDIIKKKFPGVSDDWLDTGEGPMLISGKDMGAGRKMLDENGGEVIVDVEDEEKYVPASRYNDLKKKYDIVIPFFAGIFG